MDGFKNTTRMKIFGDEAPQAYAKGGSVKPMAKAAPKKADAKYPVKRKDGDLANMTPAERRASMEQTSRAMTPAQAKSLQALKNAKAAAPKQGPLIKPVRQMTPAERRMNQMDRPTNNMGAEAYKGGGKVGGSKVPFAVKKVMRKAEGGAVSQIPEMPNQPAPPPPLITPNDGRQVMPAYNPKMGGEPSGGFDPSQIKRMQELAAMMGNMPPPPQEPTPQSVFGTGMLGMPATVGRTADMYGTSPGPMPTMPNEPVMPSAPKPSVDSGMVQLTPGYIDNNGNHVEATYGQPKPQRQFYDYVYTPENSPEMFAADRARVAAAQADRAATLQAQQEMAAQAQMDRGLGRGLAPQFGRGAPPRFMR